MSLYTRLASTNPQEESIAAVEKAFKTAGVPISGYTTIGKSPQTVILDIHRQDSKVHIDSDGEIGIDSFEYKIDQVDLMAKVIKVIKEQPKA